jgi:hypothetical protein
LFERLEDVAWIGFSFCAMEGGHAELIALRCFGFVATEGMMKVLCELIYKGTRFKSLPSRVGDRESAVSGVQNADLKKVLNATRRASTSHKSFAPEHSFWLCKHSLSSSILLDFSQEISI